MIGGNRVMDNSFEELFEAVGIQSVRTKIYDDPETIKSSEGALRYDEYKRVSEILHNKESISENTLALYQDIITITETLLSLGPEQHQELLANCEKELESIVPDHQKLPPNYCYLKENEIHYTELESTGFLGLQKKAVDKQKLTPNSSFQKLESRLNGDSFIFLYSKHADLFDSDYYCEYDDAILLTESGEFLNVLYVVYFNTIALHKEGSLKDVTSLSQYDEKSNVMLAAMILTHIGLESFYNLLTKKDNTNRSAPVTVKPKKVKKVNVKKAHNSGATPTIPNKGFLKNPDIENIFVTIGAKYGSTTIFAGDAADAFLENPDLCFEGLFLLNRMNVLELLANNHSDFTPILNEFKRHLESPLTMDVLVEEFQVLTAYHTDWSYLDDYNYCILEAAYGWFILRNSKDNDENTAEVLETLLDNLDHFDDILGLHQHLLVASTLWFADVNNFRGRTMNKYQELLSQGELLVRIDSKDTSKGKVELFDLGKEKPRYNLYLNKALQESSDNLDDILNHFNNY